MKLTRDVVIEGTLVLLARVVLLTVCTSDPKPLLDGILELKGLKTKNPTNTKTKIKPATDPAKSLLSTVFTPCDN